MCRVGVPPVSSAASGGWGIVGALPQAQDRGEQGQPAERGPLRPQRRRGRPYVSPKSGRAVSRAAGEPWRDKLLPLPVFLQRGARQGADLKAIEDAFRLSSFFFARHVYEPRGIEVPDARSGLLMALRKFYSGQAISSRTISHGDTAA